MLDQEVFTIVSPQKRQGGIDVLADSQTGEALVEGPDGQLHVFDPIACGVEMPEGYDPIELDQVHQFVEFLLVNLYASIFQLLRAFRNAYF